MSQRGLLGGLLVIGGSEFVQIAIGLVRVKILAVLLGPVGVGLLGLYNNLQQGAAQVAGLGMTTSGVRELSQSRTDAGAAGRVRSALLAGYVIQGLVAAAAVWVLREELAGWLLGSPELATEVGLVGLAVMLTMLSQLQVVQLQGMGEVGAFARSTVLAALGGTVAGLALVFLFGLDGVVWFVIAQPLVLFLVALLYTRRLPPRRSEAPTESVARTWRRIARHGATMMLGGLFVTGSVLAVRGVVANRMGLDAAGQFAAAWSITLIYVAFLLHAMSADYYPRLSSVSADRSAVTSLVNDQVQLCLAIGGPMLILLIGVAPLLVEVLYSSSFAPAAEILQWQAVGNLLKLSAWPLVFVLAAAGRPVLFLVAQAAFGAVFVGLVWALLARAGLEITGIAFLSGYAVQFVLVAVLARRVSGFRWEALSLRLFLVFVACSSAVLAVSLWDGATGAVVAAGTATVTGISSLRIILGNIGEPGRLRWISRAFSGVGWPIRTQR